MAHKVEAHLVMPDAKRIQEMGRKLSGDGSLGINQAVRFILMELASGRYYMAKKRTPKPEPSEDEE